MQTNTRSTKHMLLQQLLVTLLVIVISSLCLLWPH